jgi:hypothetical protein
MTKEIELLKQQIQMLQSKLSFLEEIEKHNAKPKMTLENEGEFSIVSYDGYVYYRLKYPTDVIWYSKSMIGRLEPIKDTKTKNELESQWLMNDVKYQNGGEPYCPDEPEENEWRTAALRFGETLSSIGPYGYYDMSADEWLKWAIDTYEKLSSDLLQILNRERNKTNLYKNKNTEPYCPDEPLETDLEPSMTNCVLEGNPPNGYSYWNEWFRECGSKGILHNLKLSSNSTVENKTIRDVIDRWWMDTFTSKNMSSVNECIDDLADQVAFWILRNKK